MNSDEVSGGVIKFVDWLGDRGRSINGLRGIEFACGKGRNVIWLAQRGALASGIDFSPTAIQVAQERAAAVGMSDQAKFLVHYTTCPYPFPPASFNFAVDCFGSTDIESPEARSKSAMNLTEVLKPGGYLLVYVMSSDDEFHRSMIAESPGEERNTFIHPRNGKFEKVFDEEEVTSLYQNLTLVTLKRPRKEAIFFGKPYSCRHIWAVFQRP